jgi:hypothetical protein
MINLNVHQKGYYQPSLENDKTNGVYQSAFEGRIKSKGRLIRRWQSGDKLFLFLG